MTIVHSYSYIYMYALSRRFYPKRRVYSQVELVRKARLPNWVLNWAQC